MSQPESESKKKLVPMARTGFGTKGRKISLVSNHFKVKISKVDDYFFHYSVDISYEDGQPVEGKGVGRKVITRVMETYHTELDGKNIAYDGEKSLFTVGSLPNNKLEFVVLLEDVVSGRYREDGDTDRKRIRRPYQSKKYKVVLSYAAKIPIRAITNAIRGEDSPDTQEALRVLDIILRQNASNQGCLLVRQSFFHNDPKNFVNLNGGVSACRGFHSSFRGTQGGLSLNIDVSTTMILQPGPVLDFLKANQNVQRPDDIDWAKAKRMLKSMRIKIATSNRESKITGLSESPCKRQKFIWRRKGRNGDVEETEITVYDYFVKFRNIALRESAGFPCINIGKPKSPTFIPIELCSLVSLQRYTKSLTNLQRASLVEKSRQKPLERMNVLSNALRTSRYDSDPVLRSCGISISRDFVKIEGRVLPTPMLKVGNGIDLSPQNGRWNFNGKKLVEPKEVYKWAVVSFSNKCNLRHIVGDLIKVGRMKGVHVENPEGSFEENSQYRGAPPSVRVDKMFAMISSTLKDPPRFILCVLPDRKNSELYGPWKKKCLADYGIVTQCMAATVRINDQYLTNLLLKINAKLGGLNSILALERSPAMHLVSSIPTMILGMDVSHGSPGNSDFPSIAAVVGSQNWPSISKYKACVRTQSSKVEMIDNLFKPVSDKEDHGIIRELLDNFGKTSEGRKPDQIIIFRDGVSESQFNQVLNIELSQIIEACKLRDATWNPKFVVIVAQKNHHTKFFQPGNPQNVPPGTIIDREVCHPRNYDFYLCAHAGMIGTTRPTHYHILHDEIGIAPNELEELVHSLSYVYQKSTTAISVVSPICYAHLAAAQMAQWIKFDGASETSSSHGEMTIPNALPVPQLPPLHSKVASSMFFC